ncbi:MULTISPECIES: LacI family DNA-binding transcriptional regulator [Actinomycetes]
MASSSRRPSGRAPSMIDVARAAGVSHQTVSRVLNTPDAVREDTRRRVEQAMRGLGYRRNSTARALKTRRTGLIGVVSPGDSTFGPSRMTLAIEEAAREAGYATALSVVRDPDPTSVDEALEFFLDRGIDGIVVIAPVVAMAEAARQISRTVPVVVLASAAEQTPDMQVLGIDQVAGARMAVRHLRQGGRERIAHVCGPEEYHDAQGRIIGWREELRDAGLPLLPLARAGGWSAADGHAAARRVLARKGGDQGGGEAPDAIFAANDHLALGVVQAVREAGLSVPEDVAVVGFDDVDGADFFSPPLTTVRQPFEEAGAAALGSLFGAGAGGPDGATVPLVRREASSGSSRGPSLIQPRLVVRASG